LFSFGKILYQPMAPKDLIVIVIKEANLKKIYISTLKFDLRKLFWQTLNYSPPNHSYINS
jgi:hypothetical protein